MFFDYMELALHNIRSRKLRSWLTILGIVIGVTAVVALIAVGEGMKQSVQREFEAIGFDTVLVFPGSLEAGGGGPPGGFLRGGSGAAAPLNLDGLRQSPRIAKVGYSRVETAMVKSSQLEGQGFLRVTGLSMGITKDFPGYFRGFSIAEGREFQPDDQFVVILGNKIAADLKVTVGDEITVDHQNFRVIGILKAVEAGRGSFGFGGVNDALLVPIKAVEALYQKENHISMALLKTAEGSKVREVSGQVKLIMARQGTPVSTITAEEINERISGVLETIQMTLAAIAAISLLVGAIGVMNTMYTSVLERTREIGILKAIGAKDRDILGLFLIESGLMGLIGGIIGILGGIGLSNGAGGFMGRALAFGPMSGSSFSPSFSPELLIGTLAFSFALGAISGTWPARLASQLRPVEALRYE